MYKDTVFGCNFKIILDFDIISFINISLNKFFYIFS